VKHGPLQSARGESPPAVDAAVPDLFSEFQLKSVTLRNRIVLSPMCQYSAVDGVPTDWHLVHLGARAAGGVGLVVAEATAVSPQGRITLGDTGLWNDAQTEAFARITRFIEAQGAVPGIQIGHAGRKASASRPWEGDAHLPESDPRAWPIMGPSAVAFGARLTRVPREMTEPDIRAVQREFADSARRAQAAGFRFLLLHFAHGYLGQSFFSPLANQRRDRYGGSFENRARFLLETLAAVRAVWPDHLPLAARVGVTDFTAGEQPLEESIELVRRMKSGGLDLVDVSVGFNTPEVHGVPWGTPAFMAPFAARIGREAGIATGASWNIRDPKLASELITSGQLDVVVIGKALLADPHWVYHAAQALGRDKPGSVLAQPYGYAV
jgi:2,4-dienoyl-CoA reductase-like NADH-dependent reductase (Old Yellow Enzyme family)